MTYPSLLTPNTNYRPYQSKKTKPYSMATKMLPALKKGSTLEETTKKQLRDHRDAHFMMVDGMSKLMTGKVTKCWSSDFHVSGLQWRLIIGQTKAKKNYIPFRLRITDKKCTGPNWNVNCSVKLSVLAQTHYYTFESFPMCFKENVKVHHGSHSSISYGMLKDGYIVNDKAVFVVEITDVEASFPVTTIARSMGTAECITPFEVPPNNSRFTWKITKFSSFNGKRHSSNEFTLGPAKWIIVMYPEGKSGNFSVYLSASDYVARGPKKPTFANYKLRVLDQFKRNHHETETKGWFFCDKPEIGRKKFMPLEELHDPSNGYLVNDEIYIGVEFLAIATSENL